ncbi:MAG: hypothetical protein EPO20_24780 [Betaproteobacteria bacterium]|nr:MAG: hypothetical protein EPO20_24780 [Betaproteobacteria bacterium]
MILPDHATDCHMHVFGPFERFPLAAERACWRGCKRSERADGPWQCFPKKLLQSSLKGCTRRECAACGSEAVPDSATQRAVLADNPARLYGF